MKALTLKSFYKDKETLQEKDSLKKYQHVAFDVAYYGLEDQ